MAVGGQTTRFSTHAHSWPPAWHCSASSLQTLPTARGGKGTCAAMRASECFVRRRHGRRKQWRCVRMCRGGVCVPVSVCLSVRQYAPVCICTHARLISSRCPHFPSPNPIACTCPYLFPPQIYEQTSHPKLGSALKSLGNVYLNKYRTDPEFRVAADNGPAHGTDGDAALRTWVRAARTFERLGLTELESDYSWSCFDIGELRLVRKCVDSRT